VALEPRDRKFIGRWALEAPEVRTTRFAGLILEEPGILRGGQRIRLEDGGSGHITSGGFSPTLNRSIAFASLPPGNQEKCLVDIRGVWKSACIISTRFLARTRLAGENRTTLTG